MPLLIPHCAGTGRDAAHHQKEYTGVLSRGHVFEVNIYINPGHGSPRLTTFLGTFSTNLEAVLVWDVGNLWRQLRYPGGMLAGGFCMGCRQRMRDKGSP